MIDIKLTSDSTIGDQSMGSTKRTDNNGYDAWCSYDDNITDLGRCNDGGNPADVLAYVYKNGGNQLHNIESAY